jgi:hypothetical protein
MAEAEPRWKRYRDWTSFVVAIAAFAVSATNSYITSLRELAELRLVIGSVPIIAYYKDVERFKLKGEVSALFINAGNRPISVIGASVQFGDPDVDHDGRPICRGGVTIPSDMGFTVVDEKKIIEKNAKIVMPSAITNEIFNQQATEFKKEENDDISFAAPELLKKGNVTTCISLQFVTPREQGQRSIQVQRQTFSENHFDFSKTVEQSPFVIYRRHDWSFW